MSAGNSPFTNRQRRRGAAAALGVVTVSAAFWILSCRPWRASYAGDGRFTDHGWREGSERYELVLATLPQDAAEPHRAAFEVGQLPTPLAFGFRVTLPSDDAYDALRATRVHVRIAEASGKVALDYAGPLDPRGGAPVVFSAWKPSAESRIVTAKLGAAVPAHLPLKVELELDPPREPPLRSAVEVVLVGGGWE